MFKNRKFSGEELILIFDFLTKPVEEANTLEISAGQLMALLLHFLTGGSTDHYREAANGPRSGNVGSIVHWPEAVQHLLRTYETKQAITSPLE